MVTVEKVLAELSHIAFDDISNYLDYRTEKTVVGHDLITGQPIIDYKTIIDLKDSRTIDTRNIKSVSQGANGVFKFEQYCKDNALVQIGKHLGMFTDKVEMTGKDGAPIVRDMTDEELEHRLLELGYCKSDK
jgi:phage terminase small subunit